ncbi:trypsin-like peptidase domain-containing protein [Propionibacterium australiense]|uniref:PDZ domain-containing protein n=1 Tax=Propionibacterium australiense TaxID=119981 RepID=A0A8B3FHS8_9ACTN|nr:trypsin-like peptidase domain-containing protein [Propionibacterium australiense]RLP07661.1 PDZ domain-containing protein [Propionibacterium australiense]
MSENDGHDIPWPGAQPSGTNEPAQHGPARDTGRPADSREPLPDDDATRSLARDETMAFAPDDQQTMAFGTGTGQAGPHSGPADQSAGPGEPEKTLLDVTGQGAQAPNQWPQPDQSSMWTGQAAGATPSAQQGPSQPGWVAGPSHPQGQGGPYPYQNQNGYQPYPGQQQPYQGQGGYPYQEQPGYQQYLGQGGYQQPQPGYGQSWSDPRAENIAAHTSWDANGQFIPYQQPNPEAQGFYNQLGQWVPYQQPQKPRSRSKRAAGIVAAVVLGLSALALGVNEMNNALNPSPTTPTYPPSSVPFPTPSTDVPSASTSEQTPASDAQSRGVVLIESQLSNTTSAGTGMVLSSDGHVLTNYHVVQSSTAIYVKVASTGATFEATMIGHDATNDVALLKLNGASGLETVKIDKDAVSVGDDVTAVGNSNGQGFLSGADGKITNTSTTVTVNSELADSGEETLVDVYETSSQAVPGDSGGPLYDDEGEVTGMTTAGEQENGNGTAATTLRSWAIPIAHAMEIVDQIEAGDESGTVSIGPKAYLGVSVEEATGGLMIISVVDDGPAAQAGLEVGDKILSVNGTPVTTQSALSSALKDLEPGDKATVKVTTLAGEEKTVEVTLGESPVN